MKRPAELGDEKAAKKTCSGNDFEPRLQQVCPFRFYPSDEQWQRNACAIVGLQFHGNNKERPGGPNVALKRSDLRTVKRIRDDGNCLFRSFAYIIAGSEDQHKAVRAVILNHMVDIAHFLLGPHITQYSSVQDYIRATDMDIAKTWSTDIEMLTLAHLLKSPVLCCHRTVCLAYVYPSSCRQNFE